MFTILHISDLHFGPYYLPASGDALLRAAGELQPDLVVASGDFTQRAKRRQFQAARTYLDALAGRPQIAVPGNHDVPLYRVLERLVCPYSLYRRHVDHALESVFRSPQAVVVALNTTQPWLRITNGFLRRRQIDACRAAFDAAPAGAARIAVIHHALVAAPDNEPCEVVDRAAYWLDRFADAGTELILGGHVHRAYVAIHEANAGSGLGQGKVAVVQCGTTTSRRRRGKERSGNTFNFIRCENSSFEIARWLLDDGASSFRPAQVVRLPRGPCSGSASPAAPGERREIPLIADRGAGI